MDDELVEIMRELQVQQLAQARVLRALIASHPDPHEVRAQWRRYVTPSLADASYQRASDPRRRTVEDAVIRALQEWDAHLAEDLSGP